jgi:outer membrane lipoprotein carrier protein
MNMNANVTKSFFLVLLLVSPFFSFSQADNPANDPEAATLLQKVSDKYKAYKNISANFLLIVQHPKIKPEEDDRKYTDTLKGQITLQDSKFKIAVKDQQIICDGKNIWTYAASDKEVQLNTYEETDDMFSPSKIFMLYKEGYLYNIREKTVVNGKHYTILEMAPPNKKLTYFKIDITVDDASLQLVESKIFEKNGVRYIYKLTKQTPNVSTTDETFTFDAKKHPGVKVVDLR